MLLFYCFTTEKDVNQDVLWTWSFPSVSSSFRQVLLRKCCLKAEKGQEVIPFCYGQLARKWYYLFTSAVKNTAVLDKVSKQRY
jgi:hypothetical protein